MNHNTHIDNTSSPSLYPAPVIGSQELVSARKAEGTSLDQEELHIGMSNFKQGK